MLMSLVVFLFSNLSYAESSSLFVGLLPNIEDHLNDLAKAPIALQRYQGPSRSGSTGTLILLSSADEPLMDSQKLVETVDVIFFDIIGNRIVELKDLPIRDALDWKSVGMLLKFQIRNVLRKGILHVLKEHEQPLDKIRMEILFKPKAGTHIESYLWSVRPEEFDQVAGFGLLGKLSFQCGWFLAGFTKNQAHDL